MISVNTQRLPTLMPKLDNRLCDAAVVLDTRPYNYMWLVEHNMGAVSDQTSATYHIAGPPTH
jgi:hypothetical protein